MTTLTIARSVIVTVRANDRGGVDWIYNEDPGSSGKVIKRTACEIVYQLEDSPGFEFCAPPEIDNDPQHQLIDPSYTATTAQVTDLCTAATPVPMSIYLRVRDADGKVYRSSDPEIINTDVGG